MQKLNYILKFEFIYVHLYVCNHTHKKTGEFNVKNNCFMNTFYSIYSLYFHYTCTNTTFTMRSLFSKSPFLHHSSCCFIGQHLKPIFPQIIYLPPRTCLSPSVLFNGTRSSHKFQSHFNLFLYLHINSPSQMFQWNNITAEGSRLMISSSTEHLA